MLAVVAVGAVMVMITPDWASGLVSALRDNIRLADTKREKSYLRRYENRSNGLRAGDTRANVTGDRWTR